MNKLGKHICWKVFGFMVVCYYVDKMPAFLCGLMLLQTGKSGHRRGFTGEIGLALLVFLPLEMFVFLKIKIRLQIFNQLSGSPHTIRGKTKPQGMGLLYITWREIRNDTSPQSSRVLAVLSSADWFVCLAYLNPVQRSHNLPRGGSSSKTFTTCKIISVNHMFQDSSADFNHPGVHFARVLFHGVKFAWDLQSNAKGYVAVVSFSI